MRPEPQGLQPAAPAQYALGGVLAVASVGATALLAMLAARGLRADALAVQLAAAAPLWLYSLDFLIRRGGALVPLLLGPSSEQHRRIVVPFLGFVQLPRYLACFTALFGWLNAWLLIHGDVASSRAVAPADAMWTSTQVYLWHLLDAIPALDIPNTVRWELGAVFTDTWSGVLLVAFKAIVILPAIALALTVIKIATHPTEDEMAIARRS